MKLEDFDFRIWDNDNCEFLESAGIARFSKYLIDDKDAHFIEAGEASFDKEREIKINELDKENLEIELWTGLYDKNGKKIYEGDVIFLDDEDIGKNKGIVIKRESGEYRIEFVNSNALGLNTLGLKRLNQENLLILGNIHENAELLNENNH